jgi:glycosyltransferase involved in cell wall biosynthesis
LKNNWQRSFLRKLYNTVLGQLLWRGFRIVINQAYIKELLQKVLTTHDHQPGRLNVPDDMVLLPRIKLGDATPQKTILLITPFYGPGGSSTYTDSICRDFRDNGYRIETVLYGKGHGRPASKLWDKTYHIHSQKAGYLKTPRDTDGQIEIENHCLDDWAGDDLVQFVSSLSNLVNRKICITNYVWLSRALEAVPSTTQKVIVSHDVFADRNARMQNAIGNNEGFHYSINADDEARGLARSDLVIAISDADNDHFVKTLQLPNVTTIPYVPRNREIAPSDFRPAKTSLKIGFIGSGHRPNADAILAFIASTEGRIDFELYVAGRVRRHLKSHSFPENIHIMGPVDDVADFYSLCDVIVNPDAFESGQKIKCIEALSCDKPLVCTLSASAGLTPTSQYHRAVSASECASLVMGLIENSNRLRQVYFDSRKLYANFLEKFQQDACQKIEAALAN